MSHYIERVLGADEKIIYAAHIHWYVYVRGILYILAGLAFGIVAPRILLAVMGNAFEMPVMLGSKIGSLALIAWGTLALIAGYIRQISTELVITNRRVIAKYGFVATTTYELMITKVEGANIDQTVLGRLMGFGAILVKGTGGGISPIDHIAAPYVFHNYLMKVLERLQVPSGEVPRND